MGWNARKRFFMQSCLIFACALAGCQPAIGPSEERAQLQAEQHSMLPMQGPGLGNLEYEPGEVFKPISRLDYSNFIPPRYFWSKDYGTTAAIMHNGYFVTAFAPDSGGGPGGFLVLDVSNPRNLKLVRRIYEPEGITKDFREAHSFGTAYVGGKKLIAVQTGVGIEIWDFTDVNRIAPLSKLKLPGVNFGDYSSVSWQLWWQAPYLYVAGANQGIFIVDTSDPAKPKLADRGSSRANPVPVGELGGFRVGPIFALGNLLVISSMDVADGFSTLDIADPLNPRLLARVGTMPKYYATCFDGRYLHASVRGAGAMMLSYDLANPLQPRLLDKRLLIDEQLYCATQDQHVFQGAQNFVHKVDTSDSAGLRELGRGTLGVDHADHGQVTAFGNLVYIGNDHGTGSAFFPHEAAPDRLAPQLVRASPAAGEVNVALLSRIGLGFSDNILFESLTPENFQIRDEAGQAISGTVSAQLGLVNFTPSAPLLPQTRYEVVLKALGIRDYAGNGLATDIRYSFFTGEPLPLDKSMDYSLDEGVNSDLQLINPQFREGGLVLSAASEAILPNSTAPQMAGHASLSFYLKTSQLGKDKAWEAPGLMGRDQVEGEADIFWAWLDSKGFLHLSTGNSTGARTRLPVNDGLWHHFVLTRDASSGQLKLYQDGVLQDTQTGRKGRLELDWDRLGKILPGGLPLEGDLDELSIFDRTLTDGEAKALANQSAISLSLKTRQALQPLEETMQLSVDGIRGPQKDLTLTWDFGDGQTATGMKVEHRYQNPGFHNLRLLIASGTKTATIALAKRVYRRPTVSPPLNSSSVVSDHSLVFVVNPDSNTVTAIDYLQQKKIWEQAVGIAPRTLSLGFAGEIWIANQESDSLTVLSKAEGQFLQTITLPYGTAPYAVLVDKEGGRVYVSGESGKSLLILDRNGRLLARKTLHYKPRGLAVDSSRQQLFVTSFISPRSGAEVHRYRAESLQEDSSLTIPIDSSTVDAEDRGRGLVNYLSQVVIAPDGQSLLVPGVKANIQRGLFRDGRALTPDNSVRTTLNQISLGQPSVRQLDFNDRDSAVASVFSPVGDFIFTALQGSQSVEIIDAIRQLPVGSIDQAGSAPQGLSISPDGSYLFVQGFLSRTLASYDIRPLLAGTSYAPRLLKKISTVEFELMATDELQGKQLFYLARDPRMSRDGYISCASCHVDGGEDGQVWDFTERGEGLRNTITLKGRRGTNQGRVHWTANFDEIQDFENDIRSGFGGTGFLKAADFDRVKDPLGPPKAGLSQELDALAAYVSSLKSFGRSPFRPAQGELTTLAETGREIFAKASCASCHSGVEFTDGRRHDIGTLIAGSGKGLATTLEGVGFETPTLRGVWDTAPYLHAGQAPSVQAAIEAHGKRMPKALTQEELQALEAYVLSLE